MEAAKACDSNSIFCAAWRSGDEEFDEANQEFMVSDVHFEDSVVERDLVQRVLAQLPSASAMCLILDAEGFTYNEIAETMQDTLSAVRSRLARARQSFQRIYAGLDQEGHANEGRCAGCAK